MSIAQLRATRISPHLLLVALVLAAVAALALTLAPAKGAAWDTRVYFDHDNDDVLANTAVATAMTSATANAGTDTQAHTIFAKGSTVAEGTASSLEIVSEMGLAAPGSAVNIQLSVTVGNIGVANGPKLTNLGAVASSTAGDEVTLVPIIFANGAVGDSAITADNVGGAGANVAGVLTIRDPIGTVVLDIRPEDQLLTTVSPNNITMAITATAKNGLGEPYSPDVHKMVFQSSNAAAGQFTMSGAVVEVAVITVDESAATATASVTFTAGTKGGESTDITALIDGVTSNTIAIRVGGPVADLVLSVTRVTALDMGATVAGGELFALANAELGFSDNALVRIAATDSTGGVTEATTVPMLVDTQPAGGVEIGMAGEGEGIAMGRFSDPNALAAAVLGEANAVLNADGATTDPMTAPATLGTHSLRASMVVDTVTVLSNTVDVLVSGPPATIDKPTFTINTAQVASLAADQTATSTVTARDAGGRIVPDGTAVSFSVSGGAVWGGNGLSTITPPAGTNNGAVSAVLQATGTSITVTVRAFSEADDTIVNSNRIRMTSQSVGSPVPNAVAVSAGATELAVGESTSVMATVTDQNGAALADALVRFTENVATATIDGNPKLTNALGEASAVFTGSDVGVARITATVVNIVGGVIVETSVTDSIDITVGGSTRELALRAGGQFLFWSSGDATASAVFGDVKIAWQFDENAIVWTSFIPALGMVDFALVDGSVLWVVSDTAQTIVF